MPDDLTQTEAALTRLAARVHEADHAAVETARALLHGDVLELREGLRKVRVFEREHGDYLRRGQIYLAQPELDRVSGATWPELLASWRRRAMDNLTLLTSAADMDSVLKQIDNLTPAVLAEVPDFVRRIKKDIRQLVDGAPRQLAFRRRELEAILLDAAARADLPRPIAPARVTLPPLPQRREKPRVHF